MISIGAVDLGGTHTRCGLFTTDGRASLSLVRAVTGKTSLVTDIHSLKELWRQVTGVPVQDLHALVIAVAGPVTDARYAVTSNAHVHLDLACWDQQQCPCMLVNDFVCEAYAALTDAGKQARPIFGPAADPAGVRAVLGPGTGLGAAQLVPCAARMGGWLALPSEFGHAPFPFVGREEADFAAFASERFDKAWLTGDDVVSGRGLACLHAFLSGESGPPEAASVHLRHAGETRRWYARFLGRICAQWALATLCYGGLYLTGGMLKRQPDLPTDPAFIEAFFCAPRLRVLERIPLRRYAMDMSGLWGAAWLGKGLGKGRAHRSGATERRP